MGACLCVSTTHDHTTYTNSGTYHPGAHPGAHTGAHPGAHPGAHTGAHHEGTNDGTNSGPGRALRLAARRTPCATGRRATC